MSVDSSMNAITLRFRSAELEARYRRAFVAERRGYLRVGIVLLSVLYAVFGLVDHAVFPESRATLHLIRYGIVLPLMLIPSPIVLWPRFEAVFQARVQEILFYVGFVATAGILAMGATTTRTATQQQLLIGTLGLLITLTFLYGFTPMRFVYATVLGLSVTTSGFLLLLRSIPKADVIWFGVGGFAFAVHVAGAATSRTLELLSRQEFLRREALAEEEARSLALLESVLPKELAERLRAPDASIARAQRSLAERHDAVTVIVVDVVGFTPLAEKLAPEELAALLGRLFAAFDELAAANGVETIKTLGDAWIAAAGVPSPVADHAARAARLARELPARVRALAEQTGHALDVRIGVASGPAVAGVIGRTRFAYDLWGEAVDLAKAMESGGVAGRVRISPSTRESLGADAAVEVQTSADSQPRILLA